MASTASRACRDRKEPEPGKNEPNQNPGFVKNRTEHEPESKQNVQVPEPNPVKNRTEREPKCRGSLLGSFTEWNCRHIHIFHSKRGILLYLG